MLPNSAISWGFKLPTTGVCDGALVNTETESQFRDFPDNARREQRQGHSPSGNWGRGKREDTVTDKKKGESGLLL